MHCAYELNVTLAFKSAFIANITWMFSWTLKDKLDVDFISIFFNLRLQFIYNQVKTATYTCSVEQPVRKRHHLSCTRWLLPGRHHDPPCHALSTSCSGLHERYLMISTYMEPTHHCYDMRLELTKHWRIYWYSVQENNTFWHSLDLQTNECHR